MKHNSVVYSAKHKSNKTVQKSTNRWVQVVVGQIWLDVSRFKLFKVEVLNSDTSQVVLYTLDRVNSYQCSITHLKDNFNFIKQPDEEET